MSIVIKAIAIAFIASCLVIVGIRITNADWSSRPSRHELKSAQNEIWPQQNSRVVSTKWISKLTFLGYSSSIRSSLDYGSAVTQHERHAVTHGWILKEGYKRPDNYRAIYCLGDIAQDIEIRPANSDGGVIITAGSYWAADRGDSRFCRKKKNSR